MNTFTSERVKEDVLSVAIAQPEDVADHRHDGSGAAVCRATAVPGNNNNHQSKTCSQNQNIGSTMDSFDEERSLDDLTMRWGQERFGETIRRTQGGAERTAPPCGFGASPQTEPSLGE